MLEGMVQVTILAPIDNTTGLCELRKIGCTFRRVDLYLGAKKQTDDINRSVRGFQLSPMFNEWDATLSNTHWLSGSLKLLDRPRIRNEGFTSRA